MASWASLAIIARGTETALLLVEDQPLGPHVVVGHEARALGPLQDRVARLEVALGVLEVVGDREALDPSAISCFRVRSLLSMCDVWPKDKFFEAWADAVSGKKPYRFTNEERIANVAVLEALATSTKTGKPERVRN